MGMMGRREVGMGVCDDSPVADMGVQTQGVGANKQREHRQ